MKKRHKKQRAILIALVVILGLGFLSFTGHYLNERYDWVNKTKDFLVVPDEDNELEYISETASEEFEPSGLIRHIGFDIQTAYGLEGVKTIQLVLTPSNADVGTITWNVDTDKVRVTPSIDGKSADIYVTTYFAPYATLTVTESFSELTATGKVYSFGETKLQHGPGGSGNLYNAYGGGYESKILLTEREDIPYPADQSHYAVSSEEFNAGLNVLSPNGWKYLDMLPAVDWFLPLESLWLHVGFVGSYSPLVRVDAGNIYSDNPDFYNLDDLTVYGRLNLDNPAYELLSLNIPLYEGINTITIFARSHIGEQSVLDSTDGRTALAIFKVIRGIKPEGMSIPDTTFYE